MNMTIFNVTLRHINVIFKAILLSAIFNSAPVSSQDTNSTADTLLLEATKENYKLDNDIREEEWNKVQQNWGQVLSEIEKFINGTSRHEEDQVNDSIEDVNRLTDNALSLIKKANDSLRTSNLLLEGIGKFPLSNDEPVVLSVTRKHLIKIQKFHENQISNLNQLISSAGNLKIALTEFRRAEFTEIITTRVALPFLPTTITTATTTAGKRIASFVESSRIWRKEYKHTSELWTTRIAILSAIFLAYFLGKYIHRRFGRNADIENPSHSKKLFAAIAVAFASGIIPMTIIGILFFLLNSGYSIDSDTFHNIINTILFYLLVLSIAFTLCIAFLSPNHPQWRLTKLNAQTSSIVGRGLIFLIFVVIADGLIFSFLNIEPEMVFSFSEAESRTTSFFSTIFNILKAIALIYLCRPSVWETDNDLTDNDASTLESIWKLTRMVIIVLSFISIIASLAGHVFFGWYITLGIFITIIVLGISLLIRETVHDVVGLILKQKWLRKYFALRILTLQKIKFWSGFIIDPMIFGMAFLIIMPFWGVPVEKLFQWFKIAFEGFSVGELRISLKGILLCIIVFMVLMRLTRFIQKFTQQNILPKSSQNIAQQHNTLTIINYIGVLVALGASIAALGIDFHTIAIIMGALSVGIGFGLRNIASNFISGILLLIERPIKVGDWIQIGEHEGFVEDVKFRSTELKTFQQASVIIPNADLISQPVINMTFADLKGRLEVPISVAYRSNPEEVQNILLAIGQAHPDTLKDPEPQVLFMNFGESSMDFELRCFTNDVINKVIIASDLRFEIEIALRERGIEIPFPQRVIHVNPSSEKDKIGS